MAFTPNIYVFHALSSVLYFLRAPLWGVGSKVFPSKDFARIVDFWSIGCGGKLQVIKTLQEAAGGYMKA